MFTSLLNSALLVIEKDFKVDSNIDRYIDLFQEKKCIQLWKIYFNIEIKGYIYKDMDQ